MSSIFGSPAHIAFVVPDLNEALARLAASGIGPAFELRRVRGSNYYRGEPIEAVVSAAFVCSGDTLLEFITPHDDARTTFREFLDRNPNGGLHHIAYVSSDFDRSIARAKEQQGIDFRIVLEDRNGEGGKPHQVYVEPVGIDNPVLLQLHRPGALQLFYDTVRTAARDWDGSHPIRDAMPFLAAEPHLEGIESEPI